MNISCEGDYGDLVMLLGVVQHIPNGPHRILLAKSNVTKIRTDADVQKLHDVVAPLATIQPYILECRTIQLEDVVQWRSAEFRGHWPWCPNTTLLGANAHHLQSATGISVPHGTSKWLTATPSPLSTERIIVNRTGRYRNPNFPWSQVVNFYGDRLLFVGAPHEYRDFCGEFGAIEFKRTANMREVAELIAGSILFIGNQSSPNAVAEGLKHPLIQESSLSIPDCLFPRQNAQHVSDGACLLPSFDGGESLILPTKLKPTLNLTSIPPNGWQHPGQLPSKILSVLVEKVAKAEGLPKEEAQERIVDSNVLRVPGFFEDSVCAELSVFRQAMRNAAL